MCGIAGIIAKQVDKAQLESMLTCLVHRGPESSGTWVSNNGTAAFGHRRLAIQDLSPLGHQPMLTKDGRYAITFNGEIYNCDEIRKELQKKGFSFISTGDTEVLLAAYVAWGKDCLQKLNGMFSFAIWDEKNEELFAARDRMGEKPFKYYHDKERFIFASELKAILANKSVPREVDWQAIDCAMSFRFVAAPQTGFKHIKKLPAGHYLIWKNNQVTVERYWRLEDVQPEQKSSAEWKEQLWSTFKDAVEKRLISDVSVGALLSGGIDSTSVVAAISEVSKKPIDTFVISINEDSEDQQYAREAARFYKTNHHEIAIKEINYATVLEQLAVAYDEPFFDQSALPSLIISSHIKKQVTVVLTGDGGDELFAGYSSYPFAKFLQRYHRLPGVVRRALPNVLSFSKTKQYYAEVISQDFFDAYTDYYALWKTDLPKSKKYITKADLYRPELKNKIDMHFAAKQMKSWFGNQKDLVNAAMHADIVGRLADGYLTKVDVAMMQSAVEARPPFLDHRLVEMSQRIPSSLKIVGKNQKQIWKETIKDKVPASIINRRKVGFGIPLHAILKTDLREKLEATILQPNALVAEHFSLPVMKQLWSDHLAGKADYSNHLWSIFMLELWLKKYSK